MVQYTCTDGSATPNTYIPLHQWRAAPLDCRDLTRLLLLPHHVLRCLQLFVNSHYSGFVRGARAAALRTGNKSVALVSSFVPRYCTASSLYCYCKGTVRGLRNAHARGHHVWCHTTYHHSKTPNAAGGECFLQLHAQRRIWGCVSTVQ